MDRQLHRNLFDTFLYNPLTPFFKGESTVCSLALSILSQMGKLFNHGALLLLNLIMSYKKYTIAFLILLIPLLVAGCGSKFSSLLSVSLSENHVLAVHGAEVSHPELNDGDLKTWGITRPPKRIYTVTFPEEKQIDRIVVYSGNVVSYQLACWNSETGEWEIVGGIDSIRGGKRVTAGRNQLKVPQFIHRINCRTDKIRLRVLKAKSDGVVTTRTPPKDAKILNQRVDYLGTGRRRVRIDLYDIYKRGNAMIREIEAYSYVERPETEPN